MRVRTATPADIPAMMELERQCATAAHWTERQYQRVFQTSDASHRLVLVMVEDDDPAPYEPTPKTESSLIGFLIAHHMGQDWELENVVVKSPARRKRVGTALLNQLLVRARSPESESVFLEVRESNQAARALYLKWGFQQTGRRRAYYTSPTEDAILYQHRLP